MSVAVYLTMHECSTGDTDSVSGVKCTWLDHNEVQKELVKFEGRNYQHPDSKLLKFGIDSILSKENPVSYDRNGTYSPKLTQDSHI